MTKHLTKPYDPLIPPERDVIRAKMDMLTRMQGTYKIVRYGEEYLCTCTCNSCVITSDEVVLADWRARHEKHEGDDD